VKKIPISTSKAALVTPIEAWTAELAVGSFFRRFWTPRRISCLIPVEFFVALFSSVVDVGTLPSASPT
jgi:hypothetical protein